uniref:HEAT repeat domain-containing protein n=1 Tax=Plectus sambesii TaxID=2011161 RepID=A0A914UX54_9BILA
VAPILRRLARAETSGEEAEVIRELQEMTSDRADGARLMLGDLQRAFVSSDVRVRETAFAMAMQVLRSAPHLADRVVAAFLVALDHPDSEIARAALTLLPEIASLCRDHASELLEAGFRCAIGTVVGVESARIVGRAVAAVHLDFSNGKAHMPL